MPCGEPSCRSQPGDGRGFTLLEMLVSVAILGLLMVLLSSAYNQSLIVFKRSGSQTQVFQNARAGFEVMVRQLNQSVLNSYWDYDNATNPTSYLRKSWLAFVSGRASTILGAAYGPGQAVFFQAPAGLLDDPAVRQLNLILNTCGFYIQRGDANKPSPGFMNLPTRNRYRLMQLQTSGERMTVYANRADNSWITGEVGSSRVIAENVVLLVVRPISSVTKGTPPVAEIVDLAGSDYLYDTRTGETTGPQPVTANQLPPLVELTMVAVTEESMLRHGLTEGYVFSSGEVAALFQTPSDYGDSMDAFEGILKREKLDYRVFRQQISLPNSKWSN